MVAFLPLAASGMLWLRPSNNEFGALLSSPLPEEPRIVPADAIVAAQSKVNATKASLVAIRFVIFSPHAKLTCASRLLHWKDVQRIAAKRTTRAEEILCF